MPGRRRGEIGKQNYLREIVFLFISRFAVSRWHSPGPAGLCLVRPFASIRDGRTNGHADCYNNALDQEISERPPRHPGFRGSTDWNATTDEPERAEVKRAATRKCRRRSTRRGRPVRLELLALVGEGVGGPNSGEPKLTKLGENTTLRFVWF